MTAPAMTAPQGTQFHVLRNMTLLTILGDRLHGIDFSLRAASPQPHRPTRPQSPIIGLRVKCLVSQLLTRYQWWHREYAQETVDNAALVEIPYRSERKRLNLHNVT